MRWSDAVRVGITVVAAAGLGIFIWLVSQGIDLFARQPTYVRVVFANAQGIQPRADVLLNGVKVGQVTGVTFQENHPLVTMALESPTLPERVRFRIVGSVLGFGQPHVEIVSAEAGAGQPLPPRGTPEAKAPVLQGESPTPLESMAPELANLMPKAEKLVDNLNLLTRQMSQLTTNFNQLASDPHLRRNLFAMTDNLAVGSRNLAGASGQLAQFARSGPVIGKNLEKSSGQLNDLLAALQLTGARFQGTLTKMDAMMGEFQGMATEFHGTATELHGATTENRQRVGVLMAGLQDSLKMLTAALEQVQSLVGDPLIRASFQQTAANVRDATANLKQVTADVHSLTGDPGVQSDLRLTLQTLRETTQEALVAFQQVNRLIGTPGDRITRLRERARGIDVNAAGLVDTRGAGGRVMVDATVPWADRSFWRFGIFDAGESNGFNAQYGQRLQIGGWQPENTWFRLGVHASHVGAGLDWGSPQRPHLAADLYNANDPRLDLLGSFHLSHQIDANLGLDNVFRRPSPVLGLRFHYER
jgi:phospholipid/cholesterol/gamma-HCH transport system substrate-binding protein